MKATNSLVLGMIIVFIAGFLLAYSELKPTASPTGQMTGFPPFIPPLEPMGELMCPKSLRLGCFQPIVNQWLCPYYTEPTDESMLPHCVSAAAADDKTAIRMAKRACRDEYSRTKKAVGKRVKVLKKDCKSYKQCDFVSNTQEDSCYLLEGDGACIHGQGELLGQRICNACWKYHVQASCGMEIKHT